jgi:LacI family transcriptional regulator
VALLIETSRSYTRGLLRGIRHYISEHGPWSVFMEQRALESSPPPWLRSWKGDGILTRTGTQATADAIRRTGVPTVELRATKLRHRFPFVGVDNRALGRMVAEHLAERGFRNFACYDIDSEIFFEERRDNFVATVKAMGHACHVLHAAEGREKPRQWEAQQRRLVKWLIDLPKPVGIMACTDQLGFWLLDACLRAGVAVPEQAAVVGVENDESLCMMSTPALSSVQFNAERIGYEAAALLDRMMRGRTPAAEMIEIEPLGIVTRPSSDIVAIDDPVVAQAVMYIRDHADAALSVEDVLDVIPISRSALERRMQAAVGRSPKAEILRAQLSRVKQLLCDTDLSLAVIADRCGFKHPQYMSHIFKKKLGQTPGEYRAGVRPG